MSIFQAEVVVGDKITTKDLKASYARREPVIIDDVIPEEQRAEIWNYLGDCTWWAKHEKINPDNKFELFTPNKDGWDFCETNAVINKYGCSTVRSALAREESDLEKHGPIQKLWVAINSHLGDRFELTGAPEGMGPLDYHPDWRENRFVHPKPNKAKPSWRVFTNGRPNESVYRSYGIHRDNINMEQEGTYNILYCANPEWYPTWLGECVFYNDEATGDTQQFQAESWNQSRGFNVGWPTAIIGSKPGRLIIYDSRVLHNTRPASSISKGMRVTVSFRARLK